MIRTSIIIPNGEYVLSSVVGTYKVLIAANQYLAQQGQSPAYQVNLLGNSEQSVLYNGLFTVTPNVQLSSAGDVDLIIIPAIRVGCVAANEPFMPYIMAQYSRGAELASLCTGAFLLASTGLLDGKQCSTHWNAADSFKARFPKVRLAAEKIITDEQGIYTSGGAFSFLNLVLYLVEKHNGREVAVYLSKLFEVELERDSQSPFIIFEGQKDHEDEPILKAQSFIEENIAAKISVDQLASLFAISKRNFERRFRKATANSPAEYLQRVRIEAAKKALESSNHNVSEVMYTVGYSDHKAFRAIFKRNTGLSPLEYRRKYNRQMLQPTM